VRVLEFATATSGTRSDAGATCAKSIWHGAGDGGARGPAAKLCQCPAVALRWCERGGLSVAFESEAARASLGAPPSPGPPPAGLRASPAAGDACAWCELRLVRSSG
jgi:hypothetical protein